MLYANSYILFAMDWWKGCFGLCFAGGGAMKNGNVIN
jgi:hypothetical protein